MQALEIESREQKHSQKRQLRATDIFVIVSSQFSCPMLMSKFQDVIKTWGLGPPKIPPTCPKRLGTFYELPALKPLKYKNFVSSISAKRSCLDCIPNN